MARWFIVLAALVLLMPLAGCLAVGNGNSKPIPFPTIADEIKALKSAHSCGDITEQEYAVGMSALGMRR